ncbi:glutamate N-acetyltransferase [Galdieria sulphuraria]|uniref:Glutamate N-acetyltransferase n=1 Tax=Galdieria sulphuraria TaxID=130081 RepID=M2Y2K4_GALSU|nr:glutamate N-acetyltransferase [Galdieria sulphuraria]EME30183.1 glutamate N-acetyltransferase [Galdieria sulphuraria]|eukprot:XP_005706703.1 glutamate N-acetyltransferase [Galdieria sulphuraria]
MMIWPMAFCTTCGCGITCFHGRSAKKRPFLEKHSLFLISIPYTRLGSRCRFQALDRSLGCFCKLANWFPLNKYQKDIPTAFKLLFAVSKIDKANLALAFVLLGALYRASSHSCLLKRQISSNKQYLLYETCTHQRIDYFLNPSNGDLLIAPSIDSRTVWRKILDLLNSSFLPENCKKTVSKDYFWFTTFNFLQNVVNCCIGVISTQQLLRAVGLSASQGIGKSASLNWVLKDGIGRLGAIVFGSFIGNRFDADPKRWRLWGDILYAFGIGTEIISPLLPRYFLLVASLANMVKATSYMLRLPTTAAIRRSFAKRENFGDISAKANSQEVLSNLFGTFLGIGFSIILGHSWWQLSVAYFVYFIMFFLLNYLGVKGLHLRTLNLQRSLLLGWSYWKSSQVSTVEEVNYRENVILPSIMSFGRYIRFGVSLRDIHLTGSELAALLDKYRQAKYLLTVRHGQVYIVFHMEARVKDELQAILQATFLAQENGCICTDRLEQSYTVGKPKNFYILVRNVIERFGM